MLRRMTRPSIPAKPAIHDAVTLEAVADASPRDGNSGRVLAQLEHNAMLAFGTVRAGMAALHGATLMLEPIAQLLSQKQAGIDATRARELRRLIDALKVYVQTSAHAGQALLQGGSVLFALDDPWLEASELLQLQLPDLQASVLGADGLAALDFGARTSALLATHHVDVVRTAIAQGHASMQRTIRQLNIVLMRMKDSRSKSSFPPPPGIIDDFANLTGRVRDHILRSGPAALRVQGPPSSRAASLVEGAEEQR
jgi:hypothetical protein